MQVASARGCDAPSSHHDRVSSIHGSHRLRTLWADAGLEGVETHSITVQRSFADFDEFWSTNTTSGAMTAALAALDEDAVTRLREAVRAGLMADAHGKITYSARAHAI